MGFHICDEKMTRHFKTLFSAKHEQPTKETLGELFGNPVLE